MVENLTLFIPKRILTMSKERFCYTLPLSRRPHFLLHSNFDFLDQTKGLGDAIDYTAYCCASLSLERNENEINLCLRFPAYSPTKTDETIEVDMGSLAEKHIETIPRPSFNPTVCLQEDFRQSILEELYRSIAEMISVLIVPDGEDPNWICFRAQCGSWQSQRRLHTSRAKKFLSIG